MQLRHAGGGAGHTAGRCMVVGQTFILTLKPYEHCAEDERRCDCGALAEALRMLPGAQRMVVGHTIQDAGINSACDGRVVRIDVGLSAGCGDGDPQVREGLGSLFRVSVRVSHMLDIVEARQLHAGQPQMLL